MPILERNQKDGRLIIRSLFGRIGRELTQSLTTSGEDRLLRAGLREGDKIPRFLLEQLEEYGEVSPARGIFRGQRSFDLQVQVAKTAPPLRDAPHRKRHQRKSRDDTIGLFPP